ncbi:MAG: hypothetical protein B6242_04255 [Anaerolineaceae bacterium 4572_78]|nr:MAG: hypothetical protein B6242_04255 [Anaerolineaceae bacterium 4572_78]
MTDPLPVHGEERGWGLLTKGEVNNYLKIQSNNKGNFWQIGIMEIPRKTHQLCNIAIGNRSYKKVI